MFVQLIEVGTVVLWNECEACVQQELSSEQGWVTISYVTHSCLSRDQIEVAIHVEYRVEVEYYLSECHGESKGEVERFMSHKVESVHSIING